MAVKNLSLAVIALLLISILLAACGAKSSPTQESSADAPTSLPKIRIGVDANLPPFEMLDSNTNELVGFDVELMRAIAEKIGFEVEFLNTGSSQLITLVSQCQLDAGISAIAITDGLKQQMDFSDPYYTTGQVLVVKKGNIVITGLDTLSDMTVGTQAGSLSEIEIWKIPGAQAETYSSYNLAFQDLITGYIDAVIADKPHALIYVEKKPNNLKIVGEEFGSVNYGIAICKDRADLVGLINNGLASVTADGTLEKLTQKWLTNDSQ
jgi:ABC-type amino acid transport substrate-binding protein